MYFTIHNSSRLFLLSILASTASWIKDYLFSAAHSTVYVPAPESIRACFLAAASSILIFGIPDATAFAIPPISSICTELVGRSSVFVFAR